MIHDLANENHLYSHTGKVQMNNKYVLQSKDEISCEIMDMIEADVDMKELINSIFFMNIIKLDLDHNKIFFNDD